MAFPDRPAMMWVTDRSRSDATLPELASKASPAQPDLIQIREFGLDRLPLELLVRAIQAVSAAETVIVINSDIELARKLGTGVHLPEHGPSIQQARSRLGGESLVGRSVHTPAVAAAAVGADYLIAGHVFETCSKAGKTPIGLGGFAAIVEAAPAPVLAIGGITPERVPQIMQLGGAGVAVMSPFTSRDTIARSMRSYRSALEESVTHPETPVVNANINGKPVSLPAGTTIAVFLKGRELHERLVVVERNGEIVKRTAFPEIVIEEGDLLEIVHFVGGG